MKDMKDMKDIHSALVVCFSPAWQNCEICENCENCVIMHVDCAEARKCKYSSEVLSCHFGQNLPQLNLHR